MCSNNISGFINKENVKPLSTIGIKPEKLDNSELNAIQTAPLELKSVVTRHCDLFLRDDEDTNSDDIGADILKVRKRRADSPPRLKLESLALNQKFYFDLNSIYVNGFEYSFEEIRYQKWLNFKKQKAEKQSKKEMVEEIAKLKRKIVSNEQAIELLQDKLSTVMELIQVKKPVSEDKQEVSVMVRDLINGSYNETQIEKTILKPVPSIPVKDFTIYKDMTMEDTTLVAPTPTNDNIALIRFDSTESDGAVKHIASALSSSKQFEKSNNQTFCLRKPETTEQNFQTQKYDENSVEIKKQTCKLHEDSIENREPILQIHEASVMNKIPETTEQNFQTQKYDENSVEIKKQTCKLHEDSIENREPTLQIHEASVMNKIPETTEQNFQTQKYDENLVEIKKIQTERPDPIDMDSIEIKEPDCDFLVKFSSDTHDHVDMEIEKVEHQVLQIKSAIGETTRKSLLGLRDNNKLSVIAENSRDSTNVTEKNSPVKMCPPVVPCKSFRNDLDLADLSVNPIIHRGSMNFRFSEAFTMHIPNSEDECVPKSCSTPGKTQ